MDASKLDQKELRELESLIATAPAYAHPEGSDAGVSHGAGTLDRLEDGTVTLDDLHTVLAMYRRNREGKVRAAGGRESNSWSADENRLESLIAKMGARA